MAINVNVWSVALMQLFIYGESVNTTIARIVVEAIDSYNTEITEATMNISKRLL